jgi:ATPase subunit of ABC transporter with duplicated ATPase domains
MREAPDLYPLSELIPTQFSDQVFEGRFKCNAVQRIIRLFGHDIPRIARGEGHDHSIRRPRPSPFSFSEVLYVLMSQDKVIIRFDEVSFGYGHNKPILDEVSFTLRQGSKTALMGQNGAGKSTIFSLIAGVKPDSGTIHKDKHLSIAMSRQVIPRNELALTVREFFERCFKDKVYDIDPRIDKVLEVVNLHAPHERIISSFSGGQQARLLLASALIQDPDILLDKAGILHLTEFLVAYKKTCMVISHDAEFLNAFTEGVYYLDVFTHKVEHYAGNYFDVIKAISARIEKENRKNALLAKAIQENKDQANVFSHKGGNMRALAKRMREKVEEMEEELVDVRKEDKAIRPFTIPAQTDYVGEALTIDSLTIMKTGAKGGAPKAVEKKVHIVLRKKQHLLLQGPNGIGKSTLLESIALGIAKGARMHPEVRVGYYRQDFSTLNFEDTVYRSLAGVMKRENEEELRSVAAGFLITKELIHAKIGSLSEGQKGLVAFARLVLERPGLLILDEPTNHINFRHIPIIAAALSKYEGSMILVSHVPEFVKQIRIDDVLDLEK